MLLGGREAVVTVVATHGRRLRGRRWTSTLCRQITCSELLPRLLRGKQPHGHHRRRLHHLWRRCCCCSCSSGLLVTKRCGLSGRWRRCVLRDTHTLQSFFVVQESRQFFDLMHQNLQVDNTQSDHTENQRIRFNRPTRHGPSRSCCRAAIVVTYLFT